MIVIPMARVVVHGHRFVIGSDLRFQARHGSHVGRILGAANLLTWSPTWKQLSLRSYLGSTVTNIETKK